MDQKVLDTQKWLNNTYGNVSGYDKVTEDGLTGWNTIYSLREGLQHELGLTEIGSGFGDATMNAVKQIVGDLVPGYKGNIAQLIQGAFWCKGISPVTFNNEFTTDTKNAFIELQEDAGLSGTGVVTADLMKALFDMSAFVLVPGNVKKELRKIGISDDVIGKIENAYNIRNENPISHGSAGILKSSNLQTDKLTDYMHTLDDVLKTVSEKTKESIKDIDF